MQLIFEFNNIFAKRKLKLKLTPYEIISIGPEGCLVEMVKDATSIDALKKVRSFNFCRSDTFRTSKKSTIERFLSTNFLLSTTRPRKSSPRQEGTLHTLWLLTLCCVISFSLRTDTTETSFYTETAALCISISDSCLRQVQAEVSRKKFLSSLLRSMLR
jgi:hypothetical protein